MRMRHSAVIAILLLAAGCNQSRAPVNVSPAPSAALAEVDEATLLDVGIAVFDPGIPPGVHEKKLEEEGIFAEIRRTESRFIATNLKRTLQKTGRWGAVRVVPRNGNDMDVAISGRILTSNGKHLQLAVRVADATGKLWYAKTYKGQADPRAYLDPEEDRTAIMVAEPFQVVYDQIARDLEKARRRVRPLQAREIRDVAELRFAADLAPDPYAGYLERNRKGRYQITRRPAAADPMAARIARIRDRDDMLIDTLDEHYSEFHGRMEESYDDWRRYSYDEQLALEELQRQAKKRTILGALAIAGAVALEVKGARNTETVRDVAVLGGIAAIRSGLNKRAEARIHRAALTELAQSFEAEARPMVVDIEERTIRLTGSAETQFATWRGLLRDILVTETGAPVDPNQAPGQAAAPAPGVPGDDVTFVATDPGASQ